jgi:hypothetical protein
MHAMGKIAMSTQRWPVVVITFPPAFSDAVLEEHLSECERLLRREQPFFCVRDLTEIKQVPGATLRRTATTWEQANRALLGRVIIGVANVSASTLVRGAMTAMRWISPSPFPETTVSTLQEAFHWGEGRYIERGLPVPDGLKIPPAEGGVLRP